MGRSNFLKRWFRRNRGEPAPPINTTSEPVATAQDQMAWGSHMPGLLACVGCTTGPVLEVGIGHFSTPHLHTLCGVTPGRNLISLEQHVEWHDIFFKKFHTPSRHSVIQVDDYDRYVAGLAPADQFSVAFIDNSPGGLGRSKLFEMLLPRCEFVVVHDYHKENEDHIGPLLARFQCRHHVTRMYEPPTLVASIKREIPASILIL